MSPGYPRLPFAEASLRAADRRATLLSYYTSYSEWTASIPNWTPIYLFLAKTLGWSLYYSAVRSQKAVSAYLTSKLILPFGFALQYTSERGLPFINRFDTMSINTIAIISLPGVNLYTEN